MRSILLFAVLSTRLGLGSALFSVHDDILAFPQFEVAISDSYISEADAQIILASPPKPSAPVPSTETARGDGDSPENIDGNPDEPKESYEQLFWKNRRYLCSIPIVKPPPPMNATEKEVHRAQEEKELARATHRGWELLSEMDGTCLYFISGWWSYSFCYNHEIKQFHQLPPTNGVPMFPPKEDTETASFVLGRAKPGPPPGKKGLLKHEGTELQGSGELRYLVQKLGGGTICDLTGKERRIEVQYHCNPSSSDRIGFVKEVSICCYLMVIYTPRLCNDVAFLPPREGRANMIQCKEIMNPAQIEEWHNRKEKEEELKKLIGEAEATLKGIGGGDTSAPKLGTKQNPKAAAGKAGAGRRAGEKAVAGKPKKQKGTGKPPAEAKTVRMNVEGLEDGEEYILVVPEGLLAAHDEL